MLGLRKQKGQPVSRPLPQSARAYAAIASQTSDICLTWRWSVPQQPRPKQILLYRDFVQAIFGGK
jgi:hypothetical protein